MIITAFSKINLRTQDIIAKLPVGAVSGRNLAPQACTKIVHSAANMVRCGLTLHNKKVLLQVWIR